MAGAPPMDQDATSILNDARAEAYAQLRKDYPGSDPATLTGQYTSSAPKQGINTSLAPPASADLGQTGPSQSDIDAANKERIGPTEYKPDKTVYDPPSFWNAFADVAANYGTNIGLGITKAAKNLSGLTAAAVSQGSMATMDRDSGAALREGLAEAAKPGSREERGRAVASEALDTIDKTFEPAISYLDKSLAKHAAIPGSFEDTVGGVAQGLAPLAVPVVGVAGMLANAVTEPAVDQLMNNVDLRTVYGTTGVNLLGQAAGLALPMGSTSLAKNLVWGLANVPVSAATEVATKMILEDRGYQALADKVDPLNPTSLATAGLLPAIIAILSHGHNIKKLKEAGFDTTGLPGTENTGDTGPSKESVDAANTAGGTGPTKEAAEAAAKAAPPPAAPATETATPPPAAPVGDKPSAEPSKDLLAQFKDMKDDKTPRTGVFVSKDNWQNALGSKNSGSAKVVSKMRTAKKEGRVADVPGGYLVLQDASDVATVQARLAKGEDPQSIIGEHTGAGTGKTADMTAAVQGHDKNGAVVTESLVKPEEVPAKVEEVKAAGNEPVVTTPEGVQERRAEEVAKENHVPGEPLPNGFKKGSEAGTRYRVGQSNALGGAIMLEKRNDNAGSANTFFVGSDGNFVDADSVDFKDPSRVDALWKPTPKDAAAAREILDEMGSLDLSDPKRKALQQKLKDLVSGKEQQAPVEARPTEATPTEPAPPAEPAKPSETDKSEAISEPPAKVVETAPVDPDVAAAKKAGVSVEAFRKKREMEAAKAAEKPAETSAPAAEEERYQPTFDEESNNWFVNDTKTGKSYEVGSDNIEHAREVVAELKAAEKPAEVVKPHAEVKPVEPAKPVAEEKPRAKAPKTAREALPEALKTHEKQEVPRDGRKNVPLPERQDNASAFAMMLEQAAKESVGKAEVGVIERARAAAKRAIGLTDKSKEATAKGQGTGHVKITALVAEMHKAARELIGEGKEGDGVVETDKAAEIRAKIAKERNKKVKRAVDASGKTISGEYDVTTADGKVHRIERSVGSGSKKVSGWWYEGDKLLGSTKEEAIATLEGKEPPQPKAKAEPKVRVAINDKYKDQIEPDPLGETANNKAIRLRSKYLQVEDEAGAAKARAEMEQFLHDNMGDQVSKDVLDNIMRDLDKERAINQNKDVGKKMSETVEDPEQEFDQSQMYEQGMGRTYNPSVGEHPSKGETIRPGEVGDNGDPLDKRNRWREQWRDLAVDAHEDGFFKDLRNKTDTGRPTSTHALLDHLLTLATPKSVVGAMLKLLRKYAPDLPIYIVTHPRGMADGASFKGAGGLYDERTRTIQIHAGILTPKSGSFGVRTIAHEIFHAATVALLEIKGTPFFKAMSAAYDVLLARMKNKYGEDHIEDHIAYFRDTTGETKAPKKFKRHLYGLTNVKEMVAELFNDPTFIEEIADSEFWKNESDEKNMAPMQYHGMKPADGLLKRIGGAIGRLFKADQDPELLEFISESLERGMADQHRAFMQEEARFARQVHGMDASPGQRTFMDWHNAIDARERVNLGISEKEAAAQDPFDRYERLSDVPRGLIDEFARHLAHGRIERERFDKLVEAFMAQEKEAEKAAKKSKLYRGVNAMLNEDPPPVRGVDEDIGRAAGSTVQRAVRKFMHVVKNDGLAAGRIIAKVWSTEAQLYRDHLDDFGGQHDPSNPIRELQDSDVHKNVIIKRIVDLAKDTATRWRKLSSTEDTAVGALLRDSTMNKIDPRNDMMDQVLSAQVARGFVQLHEQLQARLAKLSPEARQVFGDVIDINRKVLKEQRRAGVDTALAAYGAELTPAQMKMLYEASGKHAYDGLIGEGKAIDIGDGNEKLRSTLADFVDVHEVEGPYAHLGRHGEHVVSAASEGSREFDTEAQARKFARSVDELNPSSRSNLVERNGKWAVDYKDVKYVSMHESMSDALEDKERMERAGFDMGTVTQKTLGKDSTPLSAGMQELLTEAERKITRDGKDESTDSLMQALRSAMLQITAARSAYAGSKLARKNVAGVKATEMRKNFADHILSMGWNTAQMRTVFPKATALAKVRSMARDARGGSNQRTMDRRGVFVRELAKRNAQEVAEWGKMPAINRHMAKLGFANFLTSPSHAIVWLTQNFTTGIPLAGPRWGYAKSTEAFAAAMKLLASPAFRGMIHAHLEKGSVEPIHNAIMEAISKDKRFGKWTTGENSALRQLIDRGVINHSYSEELRKMAGGEEGVTATALDFARILPTMADQFNRVSTALAGLELTGGDIRKTADFVDEVHANYGSSNKSRAFKMIGRFPGGASVVMFKTYVQAMTHLLYGNIKASFRGERKAEAAKTVAGLVVGNALFAGVYKAIALEPLKLAMWAYHKLADDEGDDWNFEAAVHHFLVDHFGKTAGNLAANGPVPNALGFDMSSRMGLSDLLLHDPPDMLSVDQHPVMEFLGAQLGPMADMVSSNIHDFQSHMMRGDTFGAVSSVIPVKQFHDAIKAYELMDTGKQTGLGMKKTAPSKLDAFYQLMGLRPSSVALAAERSNEAVEKSKAQSTARKDILSSLVQAYNTGKGIGTANARMNSFNRRFPEKAIRGDDIRSLMRFGVKSQMQDKAAGY